jgi:hypothetical protein
VLKKPVSSPARISNFELYCSHFFNPIFGMNPAHAIYLLPKFAGAKVFKARCVMKSEKRFLHFILVRGDG